MMNHHSTSSPHPSKPCLCCLTAAKPLLGSHHRNLRYKEEIDRLHGGREGGGWKKIKKEKKNCYLEVVVVVVGQKVTT